MPVLLLLLFLMLSPSAFALDMVGIDWQSDPRLGSGQTPWGSPAAAALYCGTGPIRNYVAGDYICSDIDTTTNPDTVLHEVWQVVSVYSTNSPGLATHTFPRVNCARQTATGSPPKVSYIFQNDVAAGTATVQTLNANQVNFTVSCSDAVWNGSEEGVDCGGPCSLPCAAEALLTYDQVVSLFLGSVASAFFCIGIVNFKDVIA